jgi:hypothetical protein
VNRSRGKLVVAAVDAAAADGELAAAPWLLVAGSRPGPLALVDGAVPGGATAVPLDP